MGAESSTIIVAENHGGQSGVPMIEEPTEAEHNGAPMQQFFINAPKFEWYAQIGQGANDAARQAIEHVANPLTELTKKRVPFQWGLYQRRAFAHLKDALCTAPIFQYPNPSLPYVVVTDASQFAVGEF